MGAGGMHAMMLADRSKAIDSSAMRFRHNADEADARSGPDMAPRQ